MISSNAYIDLQVNGYAGVDFNNCDLTADELHSVCQRLKDDGVGGILATIITADVDAMAHRAANLVALREKDSLAQEMIWGIHFEGPFINETIGYRGAHSEECIHPTDMDEMKRLLDAAGGLTRIVTLAPERDADFHVTRMLADQGVVVSAGHCNSTLDELKGALDAGLQMFTHMGNGCPMDMNRHDNIIQRVLSLSGKLWVGLIADGAHIPFMALGNYLKILGLERTVVVTDAMTAAALGPGTYRLGHWTVKVGDDMVARAPDGSHLVGAAITMEQSSRNLRDNLGMSEEDIRRLMVENPRKVLNM